jgi:hypothetical protein
MALSDLLAELTAEFKELAARRKAEGLDAEEDARRKKLKAYLKGALEAQKKGEPVPEPPADLLPPPEEEDDIFADDDDDDEDGVFMDMDDDDEGEEVFADSSDGFDEDLETIAMQAAASVDSNAKTMVKSGKGGGAAAIRGKSASDLRGGAPKSANEIRGGAPKSATEIRGGAPKSAADIRGAAPPAEEAPAAIGSSNAELNPLAAKAANPKKFNANAFAIGGADGLLAAAGSSKSVEDAADPEAEDFSVEEDLLAEPEPAKKKGPIKKVEFNRNAFAIGGAADILDAAASSDAVAATDPMSMRKGKYQPSAEEVNEANSLADLAMKANEKPPPPKTAEEAMQQLVEVESNSSYTYSDMNLALEDYYGDYADEDGLEYVGDASEAYLDLAPVDPRDLELAKAGVLGSEIGGLSEGDFIITVPAGLAFLDDFPVLYQTGILPSPDSGDEPDADDPNLLIPGRRKVTVHMLNGQVKRGTIHRLSRGEEQFQLSPQGTGRAESIPFQQCKAVFVHLPTRGKMPTVIGRNLTVTFGDRRSVSGTTDDYQDGVAIFTLVPPAGARGNFERIIVNSRAVSAIR